MSHEKSRYSAKILLESENERVFGLSVTSMACRLGIGIGSCSGKDRQN